MHTRVQKYVVYWKERYMEKVQFKVYINKRIVDELRRIINLKYARYERGLLSYEVEQALRYWLALHTKAHVSSDVASKVNPTPKVVEVFLKVKDYLARNYYEDLRPGKQIVFNHLIEAIQATRGSDPRTIMKWLNTFKAFKLVKHISGAIWEICA